MALLLKQSPLVSQLVLYDVVNTAGVAADISHIEKPAQVIHHYSIGAVPLVQFHCITTIAIPPVQW